MLNEGNLSPISKIAVGILPFTLFLYTVAMMTSIAGMEIFGWVSSGLVLFVLWSNLLRPVELRPPFPSNLFLDGVLIGLFVVVAIGAVLVGGDLRETVAIIGRLRWVFLFLLLRTGLAWIWSENFSMILDFLIGILALIVVYSIYQHFTGTDFVRSTNELPQIVYPGTEFIGYKVAAFFKSSVTWGHAVALFLGYPTALFLLSAKRHTGFHWLIAIVVGLAAVSVLLTFSLGAWIAAASSLLIVSLYANRLAFFSLVLAGLIIGAGLFFAPPEVGAFLDLNLTKAAAIQDFDVQGTPWSRGLDLWSQNPFFGAGYGAGGHKVVQNADDVSHANTYIEWLVGSGAIGLGLYLLFSLACLIFSQRVWFMIPQERPIDRALVLGSIGAQVALHVGGFFNSSFKDAEINHQFLFSLSIVWALYSFYAHEDGLRIVRPKSERADL